MRELKERLYIAYGSNLNLEQMKHRCPTAEVVRVTTLHGWQLWFRGGGNGAVATVERKRGGKVPVLIWKLQPNDEKALDLYESFPRLYRKELLRMRVNGRQVCAMIYIMNEVGHPYGSPSPRYLNTIREGYETLNFDCKILMEAVHRSRRQGHDRHQL